MYPLPLTEIFLRVKGQISLINNVVSHKAALKLELRCLLGDLRISVQSVKSVSLIQRQILKASELLLKRYNYD